MAAVAVTERHAKLHCQQIKDKERCWFATSTAVQLTERTTTRKIRARQTNENFSNLVLGFQFAELNWLNAYSAFPHAPQEDEDEKASRRVVGSEWVNSWVVAFVASGWDVDDWEKSNRTTTGGRRARKGWVELSNDDNEDDGRVELSWPCIYSI